MWFFSVKIDWTVQKNIGHMLLQNLVLNKTLEDEICMENPSCFKLSILEY